MRKITNPERSNEDNRFTEGDPTQDIPATPLSADWLNALQDELVTVATARGVELDPDNPAQMLEAIKPKTFAVANQAERLALKAIRGDEVVQADTGAWYVLQGENPAENSGWIERSVGTGPLVQIRGSFDFTAGVSRQVGNTTEVSGSGSILAALDAMTVAVATNKKIATYSWDGNNWRQIGNISTIAEGINFKAITVLNTTTVAIFDANNGGVLLTCHWDGNNWSQVGAVYKISGSNYFAIESLDATTIACADSYTNELRCYRWDGNDFTLIGNSLTLPDFIDPTITAMDATTVAFIDTTNDTLRCYDWDGSDWEQVGNTLVLRSLYARPQIAAMDSTHVAFVEYNYRQLTTYELVKTETTISSTDNSEMLGVLAYPGASLSIAGTANNDQTVTVSEIIDRNAISVTGETRPAETAESVVLTVTPADGDVMAFRAGRLVVDRPQT